MTYSSLTTIRVQEFRSGFQITVCPHSDHFTQCLHQIIRQETCTGPAGYNSVHLYKPFDVFLLTFELT